MTDLTQTGWQRLLICLAWYSEKSIHWSVNAALHSAVLSRQAVKGTITAVGLLTRSVETLVRSILLSSPCSEGKPFPGYVPDTKYKEKRIQFYRVAFPALFIGTKFTPEGPPEWQQCHLFPISRDISAFFLCQLAVQHQRSTSKDRDRSRYTQKHASAVLKRQSTKNDQFPEQTPSDEVTFPSRSFHLQAHRPVLNFLSNLAPSCHWTSLHPSQSPSVFSHHQYFPEHLSPPFSFLSPYELI